jgi:ABC-type microcin C transport system permease subunit YejB
MQSFLCAALSTQVVYRLNLSGAWNTIAQEVGRGLAASQLGGAAASLGLMVSEELLMGDALGEVLFRTALMVLPQFALGLLWERYKLPGGLIATIEHLAWNRWIASPLWPIPAAAMALIYWILFVYDEEVLLCNFLDD